MSKSVKEEIISGNQLLYLKLFAYGYDDKRIFEELGVNPESGKDIKFYVKRVLSVKFQCKDWTAILKKSFHHGLLNKYDYLNNGVKIQANIYTEKIFTKQFLDIVPLYDSTEQINIEISSFFEECLKDIKECSSFY